MVLPEHPLPNTYRQYEEGYSRLSRRIHNCASVCCSCGFEGSDLGEDYSGYGSSLIPTNTGLSTVQIWYA